MEFLMTYGWALVLVLLATAALAYFGLLNPDRYISDKFILGQGLFVKDGSVNDTHVTLMVYNGVGKPIRSLTINVTNCMNNDRISTPIDMIDGQTSKIMINCTGATLGRKFKSNMVAVYYTDVQGNSVGHTVGSGELTASVQPSGKGLAGLLTIQFVSPTDASGSVLTRSFFLVNVTASHPNITGMQIIVSNASGVVFTQINPGSPFFYNFSSGLVPTTYSFYAIATASGGLSAATETRTVTFGDNQAPIFVNLQNQSTIDNTSLSFIVPATDNFGISCFSINYTTLFQIGCNGALTNTSPLNVGIYWFTVNVTDLVGNLNSTKFYLNISSAATPPKIQFVNPTNNTGTVSPWNYIIINVTATSTGASITSITAYLYDSLGILLNTSTSATSPLYVNFSSGASGLPNGVYYYNATAVNAALMTNKTETRNITINATVSPTNLIFVNPTPLNGTSQKENSVMVNVSASGNVNNCVLDWKNIITNPLGDGTDGALTVSSLGVVVNSYAYLTTNFQAGVDTITVDNAAAFGLDDEILIIQMQRGTSSNVGKYEFNRVKAVAGNDIVLKMPLKNRYYSGTFSAENSYSAQVVRIPQYTSVTVNNGASITALSWNGQTGGIVAFRANGTVTVNGAINVSSLGFRGGSWATVSVWGSGWKGEGIVGYTDNCVDPSGNGGGGGDAEWCHSGEGAGGGGYGTPGSNAGWTGYGCGGGWSCGARTSLGGLAIGSADLSTIFFGGGGGAGGHDGDNPDSGGTGGAGGGIIYIGASTLSVPGRIESNGQNAPNDATGETGGGGGGAGGSIYLSAKTMTISGSVNALGGNGAPAGTPDRSSGGAGGVGRIRLDSNSLSGSSNPGPYTSTFGTGSTGNYSLNVVNNGVNTFAYLNLTNIEDSMFEYFAWCNFTSSGKINSTEKRQLTIINLPGVISIKLVSPTSATSVKLGDSINLVVNVSCANENCGGVIVSLDPEGDFFYDSSSGVPDPVSSTVSLSRGNGGGLCNRLTDNCAPRWQGGVSNPSGTEWAVGTCDAATSYGDFLSTICGWRCGNNVLNKDLCMHLLDDDVYIDVFFTNWGRSYSNYFTYYRTTPGKGLVSNAVGTQPFYTTFSNPYTINLNKGQSQIITWPVTASGGSVRKPTSEFFGIANLSSDPETYVESGRVNITTLYPQVNITWIDPTANIDVLPGETKIFKVNVSCYNGNCGTVNVGLDPPSCNGGCVDLIVNGKTVQTDRNYRTDAGDFVTARANCQASGGDITNFDESLAWVNWYAEPSLDIAYCGRDTDATQCNSHPTWMGPTCCATSETDGCGTHDYYGCSCHDCSWWPYGYVCAFRNGKSGMVKMDPAEVPFYTTSQNPTTVSLNEGESQEVDWNVVVSGGDPNYPTSTFYGTANLSSEQRIKDQTDDINVTILYPAISIDWVNPVDDIAVSQGRLFNITVAVTCSQRDCGNVVVSLDPEGTYYFDSSWGWDYITPAVTIGRGGGGTICNPLVEGCGPRWWGYSTNPSGTEWAVGKCKDASNFNTFFSSACSSRCGNNVPNKDLCMHELSTDSYYDFYFTNWGRGWSNYFTYYRSETGIKRKGGLVSPTLGATPFYTIDDNPKIISLDEGQTAEVSWRVMPNTDEVSPFIFFAYANVSSLMSVNDETDIILVNVTPADINLSMLFVDPTLPNGTSQKNRSAVVNVSINQNVNDCYLNLEYPITPTGGEASMVGTDTLNVFTSDGTFTVPDTDVTCEVFIVAGGGGGGMDMGGGGGGGGVIDATNYIVSPGTYSVTVGAGGTGAPAACTNGQNCGHMYNIPATNGGDSSVFGMTAIGGGAGGSSYFDYSPGAGGSSGGSGGGTSGYSNGGVRAGGSGTPGQGNRGGQGGGQYYSGGGGGAGGQGADSTSQPDGGPGIANSILGTEYYWAAGGGGAGYSGCGGNGGIGGGGGGAVCTTSGGTGGLNPGRAGGGGCNNCWAQSPGGDAGANTGSGGGGGSHYNSNNKGGNGGSGIVIIRCQEKYSSINYSMNVNNNGEDTNAIYTLTGLKDAVYKYKVYCNVSTNNRYYATNETRTLNISNPPPSLEIILESPSTSTTLPVSETLDFKVNVSCHDSDCGDITVGLDPIGTYYYDSSSGIPDPITASVSLGRGNGGTLCNRLTDNCAPRWQGGTSNPSGTEWAVGECGTTTSFGDFGGTICGWRCGNNVLNKNLCMHAIAEDKYYDIYFTNWGRSWSNYFTYYRTSEKGLVSNSIGTQPFYTTFSNPYTLTLNEGESQLITWPLVASGGNVNRPTSEFFANGSIISKPKINDTSDKVNITVTYPYIEFELITPTTNTNVNINEQFEYSIKATCRNGNCGNVIFGLDPPNCFGGCVTLNVNGREVIVDGSYRMDAADFSTARANCRSVGGDITNFDEAYAYLFTYRMQPSGDHPYCGYDDSNPGLCQSNPAWGYSSCCATSPTEGCGYMDLYGCSCHECNMFGWDPGGYVCAFRSGKSGLVKMDPSEKPFYTISQNPTSDSLIKDQSTTLSWNVIAVGDDPNFPTAEFYVISNITSYGILNEGPRLNLTILYPYVNISWITPTDDTKVEKNELFDMIVEVTCSGADCGDVIVSLDPVGTYYYDSSSGVPDYITPAVSISRGGGGTICNSLSDNCRPRWQGGTTNPSGTEWAMGTCEAATSFGDFFNNACSGRCGNNIVNKDLCMHELSTDTYYDVYFTNWGRGWSNYFTYYRSEAGLKRKNGLVPVGSGTPFYTLDPNPVTINLNSGQSQPVTWRVNPSANTGELYAFYAFANVSSIMSSNDQTDTIIINTTNAIDITILSPITTTYLTSVAPVYFNLSLSNPASSCEYTLDDWATTNPMALDGTAMFASASKSTGWTTGTYTAKFRCTTPTGKVNDWMSVTFDVVTSSGALYKRPITLSVSSGATSTGYQVPLSLTSANMGNNFDWNCQQVRFVSTADGSFLPYYTESCDSIAKTATIWVKADQPITTSGYTVYAFYNNPAWSSTSNKDNVFEAYSKYPDYTGWSGASSTSTCSPGGQSMMGGFGVWGSGTNTLKNLGNLPAGNYEVKFDYYFIDSWDGESGLASWNSVNIWSQQYYCFSPTWNGGPTNLCGQSYSQWTESNPFSWNPHTLTVTHAGGPASLRFSSSLDQDPWDESWGVDNIIVKKTYSPAPTYSIGAEESG
jgi:hypothetical protein